MNRRITVLLLYIMSLHNLQASSKSADDEFGNFSSTKAVCGEIIPSQDKFPQRFLSRCDEAKAEVTDEVSFATQDSALLAKINSVEELIQFNKLAVRNFKKSPAGRILISKEEIGQFNTQILEIEGALFDARRLYQKQSFRTANELLTRVEQKLAEFVKLIPTTMAR